MDSTASTQVSAPVLEKLISASMIYANVHRGEYDASQITTEDFERAYNIAANLVNAQSWREIILGRNTTEMINLAMRAMEYDFRDGDNIVTTRLEHNSNYVPWHGLQQLLKARGLNIDIRLVDFDKVTGGLDMDQMTSKVDDRTKIVAVTGASNFMGVKPDIEEIVGIAHNTFYEHKDVQGKHLFTGSYVLVDGAQLVPGTPVDVQQMGCDFLAWSFHKMGLPLGVGGLFARQEIMEGLNPFLYGGDMIEDVKEGAVEYKDLPWRFTAGTPNILGTIATGYGIAFMMNVGRGSLIIPGYDTDTNAVGRAIETEALMNTPRGDFDAKYHVPEQYAAQWKAYAAANPAVIDDLQDPQTRLARSREVVSEAMGNIMEHEEVLTEYIISGLQEIPGVSVYGPLDPSKRAGLVGFNIQGIDPQYVAFELNKKGIEARNGNHCASLAHEHIGVDGSVRLSVYVYNNYDDVAAALGAVQEIVDEAQNQAG